MAGRQFAVTFALGAQLGSGFRAAFQSASASVRGVTGALREMERSPVGRIGAAMMSQREKVASLSKSLRDAQATLARLKNEEKLAGGASSQLALQIQLAERNVSRLQGSLNRSVSALRTTNAEAATAAGSVGRLAREYEHLSARMDRARSIQTRMAANRTRADALRAQRSDLNSRLAGTVALGASVAAPVALAVGFEDALARVGAVSGATQKDMADLTAAARALGRDTQFSASQAAQGMQYLAMAGFNTKQTIAAMPGMLNLAAAGATDLGRTADIASDILSSFNMRAEQMGEVGDILAKTFTTSNTSLEMLGESMKYVGPVAASLNISLKDTAAMTGMLANVGIKGSQGGTVLRAALLRVAAPAKGASDALRALVEEAGEDFDKLSGEVGASEATLKNLGMSVKDASGNLRPLADILEDLNARTAQMGTAERTEIFKKIFGAEASAGMIALAAQAAITVDEYGNKLVDSAGRQTNALRKYFETVGDYEGTNAEIAKKMSATTGGALRQLKSAWEDVGIGVGNLFLPAIQMASGALSRIGNGISWLTGHFPRLSSGLALAAGGVIGLTTVGFGLALLTNTLKTAFVSWRGLLLKLSASQVTTTGTTTGLTGATGGFGIASKAAGAGARFFAGGLRSILVATGVGAILVGIGYGLMLLIDNWDAVKSAMVTAWEWVVDTWGRCVLFFQRLDDNLGGIISGWFSLITWPFRAAYDAVTGIWSWSVDFFSGLGDSIFGGFSAFWDRVVGVGRDAWEAVSFVWSAATGFFSWLVDTITAPFAGFFAWIHDKFSWLFTALKWVGDKIAAVTGKVADAVTDAWDNSFGDNGPARKMGFKSIDAATDALGQLTVIAQQSPVVSARSTEPLAPVATGASRKGGGSRASGAGRSSGAGGSGGGPVTVVTLDGAQQTLFFPASGKGASGAMALPRSPELISGSVKKTQAKTAANGISVEINQDFNLLAEDSKELRAALNSIMPDVKALVRRALDEMRSNQRRTAYAQ